MWARWVPSMTWRTGHCGVQLSTVVGRGSKFKAHFLIHVARDFHCVRFTVPAYPLEPCSANQINTSYLPPTWHILIARLENATVVAQAPECYSCRGYPINGQTEARISMPGPAAIDEAWTTRHVSHGSRRSE